MPGLVGFEHFHFQLAMRLLQVQRDKACVEFMCSIFSKLRRFCLFHHFTVFLYCHVIMCCCFPFSCRTRNCHVRQTSTSCVIVYSTLHYQVSMSSYVIGKLYAACMTKLY